MWTCKEQTRTFQAGRKTQLKVSHVTSVDLNLTWFFRVFFDRFPARRFTRLWKSRDQRGASAGQGSKRLEGWFKPFWSLPILPMMHFCLIKFHCSYGSNGTSNAFWVSCCIPYLWIGSKLPVRFAAATACHNGKTISMAGTWDLSQPCATSNVRPTYWKSDLSTWKDPVIAIGTMILTY